ncbi:Sensor histidine kinase LiaS [Pontiella desulfatans]|uniref:Sensor histidine kinase LiaS n=2 Tax=Pontiella desulfatans TaxID=2750659 RepID=A0A6C2U136_PONDE|nr:Sensor histidine kinase LiaS [Pontiella desulfatans]
MLRVTGLCCGMALGAFSGISTEVVPSESISPFLIRTWRVGDGLPFGQVGDIIQRRNGFIWVATLNGAARFDGIRFQPFNVVNSPNLPDNRIRSLHEDARDILWMGHDTGHVSFRVDNDFFTAPLPPGWPGLPIIDFIETEEGVLWAVNEAGGVLRVGVEGTAAFEESVSDVRKTSAAPSRSGGEWVVRRMKLIRLEGDEEVESLGEVPWKTTQKIHLLELSNGSVAIGTTFGGLFIIDRDGSFEQLQRRTGLSANQVLSLFEDNEQTLWVGTTDALNAVRTKRHTGIETGEWRFQTLRSIAPRRAGGIWAGTRKGQVFSVDMGSVCELTGLEPSGSVRALIEDRTGTLWLNNDNGFLMRIGSDGANAVLPAEGSGDRVWALHEDHAGVLWAGGETGLWRGENDLWRMVCSEADGVSDIQCMASSENGTLWFGMKTGGLAALRDGILTRYGKNEGLPNPHITALYIDPDGGGLWVGTCGNGLLLWKDGVFYPVPMAQNIIGNILQDEKKRFWMVVEEGITVLERNALYGRAREMRAIGTPIIMDANDGLEPSLYVDTGFSTACRSSDGRLWFASGRDLSIVVPSDIQRRTEAVPVVIKDTLVNDEVIRLNTVNAIELEPGVHRMNINYSALSYIAPQRIRFKYRMVGASDEWVNMGTRRIVSYQHLPPGRYRFEVMASNSDGVWNPEPAFLSFSVAAFYWETWWFKTALYMGGFFLIVLISLGVAERINRRRLIRAESLHAVEQERTRIAMDIHDEIGSELTRITLLCNRITSAMRRNDSTNAPRHISEMERVSAKLVQSLDEIVWVVRPINDTLDSLVAYLSKYVGNFLRETEMGCDLDIPMELPTQTVPGPVRHNLFLAIKEALNNITKHAAAKRVVFGVAIQPASIRITISDNGRGIGDLKSERFQRGLENMKRRMKMIGGSFSIRSNSEGGTNVEFLLPRNNKDFE